VAAVTIRGEFGEIGPIAYGCWRFAGTDVAAARTKIGTALEVGMTLIDTADIYGYDGSAPAPGGGFGAAEELLGRVLADTPGLRDQMVLATKGGITPPVPYDSSSDYLREACEASLRRLQTDVIDIYQIHRPDLLAHPADGAGVLDDLVASGKVRAIGVSNFTVAQTRALQAHLDTPLATVQPEFSPLSLDPITDGSFDFAMETGLAPLVWSPLAGGRLAGDIDPLDERAAAVARVCDRLAAEHDVDRTAILLAWAMRHPAGVVPIVGTQQPSRIRDSARATDVEMTPSEWYEILVAGRGEPMP
jgi:aryl-alcohol dehydrogenase-like predicted oxidoreductase